MTRMARLGALAPRTTFTFQDWLSSPPVSLDDLIRFAAKVVFVALLTVSFAPHTRAQPAPSKVVVGGATYAVSDDKVIGQSGTEPLDAATVKKAQFTARVLNQQIVNSDFNKKLFAPLYRATVFFDQASGRLVEPWRNQLQNPSTAAFAKAKDAFKIWATKLAIDPDALMLAVARRDYLDGIAAYRQSISIYRSVLNQNQPLTYEAALALMRNEWPIIRLAYARGLEESLTDNNAARGGASARPASIDKSRNVFRPRSSTVSIATSKIQPISSA
jgi:hypothetical protein